MGLSKRFPDRALISAVRAEASALEPGTESAEPRRLAGRVMARRGHGKLTFIDLVDRSGRIQLLCDESRAGQIDVDLGDVVGVVGSPASSRRGEPSLAVDELTVLSRNRSPLPDTFHGVTDQETRYRKRYLDLLMNEESRELFLLRSQIVTAIRRFLDEDGFVEVETPVLQPRYGGAFAHPFVTHSKELEADLYLRIATELYLKRLIVGGLERVYEIGKDFRNESVSYKHQPEFTMLEWYEAYADFRDTMDRIEAMLEQVALDALGTTVAQFRGHEIDLKRPWKRVGFSESLDAHELWTRDEGELRARLTERGVDTEADKDWPQLVDHAFGHFVEPSLIEPTIVWGHPVELSPFARVTDDDETITERFEYFAAGMELGNAYSEINDADEQQRRFDEQSAHVEGVRGDPEYVEALSYGMPPTGGLGLGIDRLVMLFSGRETIRDVILFPALRPDDR
ncbi:MAG: lysine--tRNA ligase [Thermoleophilia bacterium]|nr:lysine--tRNA ligase [Thermoleophilia bacterium]MDH5279669.1 lysine--tRNA ligase [Thermoleophilia bacterium]